MSSFGLFRRSSESLVKYSKSSVVAWSRVSSAVRPRWNSGSSGAMISLVQRKRSCQSSCGSPSISAITAMRESSVCFVKSRMRGAHCWVIRGVKRLETTRRYWPCSGGSMFSRWWVFSSCGGTVRVKIAIRGAMMKSCGRLPTSTMSACFVMAQNGSQ